jgi:hypothetical protein
MLAISLLALIAGCVLLFLDWRNYGTDKPSKAKLQPVPMTQQDEDASKEQAAPEEKKGAEKKGAPKKG